MLGQCSTEKGTGNLGVTKPYQLRPLFVSSQKQKLDAFSLSLLKIPVFSL